MINVVFVRYYSNSYDVSVFLKALREYGAGVVSKILIVDIGDSKLPSDEMLLRDDVIRFDSPIMDVSAYAFGIEKLVSEPSRGEDDILLINDTVITKHPWRVLLRRFFEVENDISIDIACATGIVNCTQGLVVSRDSLLSSPFLSTYFFSLNQRAVPLFQKAFDSINEQCVPDSAFRAFIQLHLYVKGGRYSWGGREDCVPAKEKAVLFERLFSRGLIEDGGILIDINGSVFKALTYRLLDRAAKWLK